MRKRLLRFGFLATLLAGVPLTLVFLFSREFKENYKWAETVEVQKASKASGDLFASLYANNLIRFDSNTHNFETDPCEAFVDDQVGHKADLTVPSIGIGLQELCQSQSGTDILREISEWNASFQMLAIRDNANRGDACDDGRIVSGRVVETGCRKSKWRVSRAGDGAAGSSTVEWTKQAPPHRTFAHLARGGVKNFSDWLMVSRSEFDPSAPSNFYYEADIEGNGETIVVDLIGAPSKVGIDGRFVGVPAGAIGHAFSVGQIRVSMQILCAGGLGADRATDCNADKSNGIANSWRISVGGITRGMNIQLAIEASFTGSFPKEIGTIKLTDHLKVICEEDSGARCTASWVTSESFEVFAKKKYRVMLSDRTELVDAEGRSTKAVFDLGLASMVGFGQKDIGSISAALAAARLETDTEITLTIEPAIQALALKEIEAAVKHNAVDEFRRANARGALVLIDASDDPATRGDIIAAASMPGFEPGFHEWDMIALAEGGGAFNPLAGHAWRATDVHSMPGSTFKTITGLAAIEAARTHVEIQDIVLGSISFPDLEKQFGTVGGKLTVVDRGAEPYTLSDNLAGGRSSPATTACPNSGRDLQLGLCEALAYSINPWFAGMALLIDGPFAEAANGGKNMNLTRVVERLFPLLRPEDNGDPLCRKCVDLTRGKIPGAGRLKAEPIDIPAGSKANPARIDVASNSYGQGVRASAVAMAALYASIGSGIVVRPRLVIVPDAAPAGYEGKSIFEVDDPFVLKGLDAIKKGMRAAVKVGTAANKLGALGDQAYGKTGTADSGDPSAGRHHPSLPNSISFAGWVEPGGGIPRRMAFFCWMSHIPEKSYGGTVCAPLVFRILQAIRKLEENG